MSYRNRIVRLLIFGLLAALVSPSRCRHGARHHDPRRRHLRRPSTDSAKLSNIGRGREVAVLERAHGWVNVVGTVGTGYAPEIPRTRPTATLPDGLRTRASSPPRRPTATRSPSARPSTARWKPASAVAVEAPTSDAMRLYARSAEYFPQSPLAAESAYRAADIRWQIESADAASRPSAQERDPALHYQIDEDRMKQVIKKYPHTKWADLAAYQPHRQQALRRLGG